MAKDVFGKEIGGGRAPAHGEVEERDGVPIRPITEASLGRMMRQREEISNQVAVAVKEISQLRSRQDALEKEKSDLEVLAKRQEEYTSTKRDIMDKLDRSIMLMEKEEAQASRMMELLSVMRERFRDTLAELRTINEAGWSDQTYQVELNRAMTVVETARSTYVKGLSKVEAENWQKVLHGEKLPSVSEASLSALHGEKSFGYWVRVGLAVALPFFLFGLLLLIGWILFRGRA
jgi:hypothetical protein